MTNNKKICFTCGKEFKENDMVIKPIHLGRGCSHRKLVYVCKYCCIKLSFLTLNGEKEFTIEKWG